MLPALRVLSVALALTCVSAAPAAAFERFAAPNASTGAACSAGDPCRLKTALTGAGSVPPAAPNTVTLLPGTYDADDYDLFVSPGGQTILRGAPGQPRPTITGSDPAQVIRASGGNVLRDLIIEQTGTGSGLETLPGATLPLLIENTTVRSAGAAALRLDDKAIVRNSTAIASKAGGIAVSATVYGNTTRLVGVTALAPGGTAISGFNALAAPASLELVNTVARGAVDLEYGSGPGGGPLAVQLTTSAVRSSAEVPGAGSGPATGSRLDLAALTLDADGRPAAGSPLIDAGTVVGDLGDTDVEGRARSQGPVPDVGAFEFGAAIQAGPGAGAPPSGDPAGSGGQTVGGGGGTPIAADRLGPKLKLLAPPGSTTRAKLKKGLTLNVNVDEPGTIVVELLVGKKTLGSARGTAKKPGKLALKLKIAKKKLSGRKKLKGTLRFTATDTAKNKTTTTKKLTIS
ncbi:MAG: hypothetical protein JHC95_17050 [Solirubrobacteraceae bacterium]|nr:hypothetical protein [Solirubrobacteraceae bacterium]